MIVGPTTKETIEKFIDTDKKEKEKQLSSRQKVCNFTKYLLLHKYFSKKFARS